MSTLRELLSRYHDLLCDKAAEAGIDFAASVDLIHGEGTISRPVTFREKDKKRSFIHVHEKDTGWLINFQTYDDARGDEAVSCFLSFEEHRPADQAKKLRAAARLSSSRAEAAALEAEADRQEAMEAGRLKRAEEEAKRREEERKKRKEASARKEAAREAKRRADHAHAQATWENSPPARTDHPYLRKKLLSDYMAADRHNEIHETTARIMYGRPSDECLLMIPFQNALGERIGFQLINESGDKWYTASLYDGQYKGAIGVFGPVEAPSAICIAEGFASGYSVRQATDATFLMARDAGNLEEAALRARAEFPGVRSAIVGDNDVPPDGEEWRGNVGMYAAIKAGIAARMQVISLPLIDGKKTDAADILAKYGAEGLAEILKDKNSRIKFENVLDGIQHLLRYAPLREHEMLIGRLTAAMMHKAPFVTADEVWQRYESLVMRPAKMKKAAAMNRIQGVLKAPGNAAKDLMKLDADVHMVTELNEEGHPVVPSQLVDLILEAVSMGHNIVLRAPMGSGKTERLVKKLISHFESFVYLCHRISLSLDAAPKLGLPNYREMDALMVQYEKKFVGSVMSICAKRFTSNGMNAHCNVDFLVIDEASKLIAQCITLGSKIGKILDNTATFAEAIRTAGSVLFVDADANDALIEQIRAINERPITVIDVRHPEGLGPKWEVDVFSERHALVMEVMRCVKAGIRFRVATDNRRWARMLEAYIIKHFPGTVQLCVTREPDSDERIIIENLFKDINAAVVQYQGLIHTPVISSGVSITTPHFEKSFGFFFGTVGATECLQMMGRDRTSRDWAIWIRQTMVDSDLAVLKAREAEYKSESLHTRLCHIHHREMIRERKDLDLLLPALLKLKGHDVHAAENESAASKEMMEELQAISEKLEIERVQNIIMVGGKSDITAEEYEALEKISLRTRDEEARYIAYEVLNYLGGELTEDDIEFFEKKDGVRRVNVMECFLASEEEAIWCDKKSPDTDYGRTHAVEKRELLQEATQVLGLGEDLDGEFDAAAARRLVLWVKTVEQRMHAHFPSVISVRKETKYGVSLARRILRKMGLDIRKRKSRGRHLYSVCPDSLARIMRYIDRRHELGQALIRRIRTESKVKPPEPMAIVVDLQPERPMEEEPPPEYFADDDDRDGDDDEERLDLSDSDYAACEDWLLPPEVPY